MEVHVVQKGDTLWKISRQYGISFEELKRVNAHLANPDYIVPGMKIFLPNHVTGNADKKQPTGNHEHTKKTEEKPVTKPQIPKEELPKQKKPTPEVSPPKKPVEPKPVPPKPVPPKPTPENPKLQPKPEPVPPIQQQPTPPMQQFPTFPVVGIPCGWLPIYDADCFPHMHPNHMHPMPTPLPQLPQLPVQPESSHYQNHHRPTKPKITDEWQQIETPMIEEEVIVERPKPPTSKPKPEPLPVPLPAPQGPQFENSMPMPMPMPMPMQQHHWGCMHCGGQQGHAGHPSRCGCGNFHPMPMRPHHPHCNTCHQPIQRMPEMMPYPMQNHNWHGTQ